MRNGCQRAAATDDLISPPRARSRYTLSPNTTISIPTGTIVAVKALSIFMAAAGSMPNTTHSRHQVGGWTFVPWVPLDRLFIIPLTAFLVTILRGSVLFTSQALT
jgi:hypothetical protein